MHSHSCRSRADCIRSESANRCATAAVQQRWWLSLLVTCSESVMNACRCVASTQMICLHHLMTIDHFHVCNSHVIAVLRAGGSGIERRARQLAAIWPVQYQGSIQPSLFDSTKSARDYKVPDLPMLFDRWLARCSCIVLPGLRLLISWETCFVMPTDWSGGPTNVGRC